MSWLRTDPASLHLDQSRPRQGGSPDEGRAHPVPESPGRLNDGSGGPAFERIAARLRREGRLTFAAFMSEALYGPAGYYTSRPRLGGASADFFTSPELHPAFGALLGRFAARVWDALGRPPVFDIVEHGPGTGALARDMLDWAAHAEPTLGQAIRYRLVETSAALRSVQRATLSAAGLLDERVTWESPSGRGGHTGLILANELVDALPVHLVAIRDGVLYERYVVLEGNALGWQEDAPSTPALAAYFERLGIWPGEGCIAEVNLAGVTWAERTATTLDRGALLVLDYGYPAPELYVPDRRHGTLLTYRQHTLGSDPLRHLGEQDITAHVDFTSLARAGERGGLTTIGLISQAAFLRRLGLDGYRRHLDRSSLAAAEHDANRRALLALTEPTGLGHIQGLLQTKDLHGFDPFAAAPPPVDPAAQAGTGDEWLPLLRPGQMRLPGPLEAEGFLDLDDQWRELMAGTDEAETDDSAR